MNTTSISFLVYRIFINSKNSTKKVMSLKAYIKYYSIENDILIKYGRLDNKLASRKFCDP